MYKVILILLFIFFVINIFCFIEEKSFSKRVETIFSSLFCSFVLFFAANKIKNFLICFVIGIIYLLLISLSKFFLYHKYAYGIHRDVKKLKRLKFLTFQKLFCLLISPDYYITYYFKNLLEPYGEDRRAKLVKSYNYENMLITFIFILLNYILYIINIKFEIIYFITLYRILSRTYEIIASFVIDVVDGNKKKSTLTFSDRIGLAFLSIAEVIGLQIAKYLLINNSDSFSQRLLKAFYNVFSLNFEMLSLTDFLCYISVFSLLGIVITSYISAKTEK